MAIDVDDIARALRQAMRSIVRRPLAAATSVICLAVGIAACAAAWTIVDGAIWRPFGLAYSSRLVVLWETDPAHGHELIEVSQPNFLDWQRESRTLESMASFGSSHWPALARIGSEIVPLAARGVSAGFFATLGVRPELGRDFQPDDLRKGAPPPVILSHQLWQNRFAQSPSIAGRSLFIDGVDHEIIGVMPAGFAYPDAPDVWISVERVLAEAYKDMPLDSQRLLGVLEVVGRRRPEATNADVTRELTAIVRALRRQYGESGESVSVAVNPFASVLLGRLGSRLWIALALAATVFLFACANVTAVRFTHLRERSTELAARLFLGASNLRLRAALALETAPIVCAAAAAAWILWRAVIAALGSTAVVADSGIALDRQPVSAGLVIAVLSLAAWTIVGLLPAWTGAARETSTAPASPVRVARRTSRIGVPLVFGQAAIAIAAVAVAGAAIQAFVRLSRTDVGFATTGVTLVDINIPGWKYATAAETRGLLIRARQALSELPGVVHAAGVTIRPFRYSEIADGLPVRRTGDALTQPKDNLVAARVVVTADYFAAMQQRIVEGRAFDSRDVADGEPVVVLSRTLSRAVWGSDSAVGRRIDTFSLSQKWRSRLVIGVVDDARYRGLERPSMEIYMPDTQAATPLGTLVIASQSPAAVDAASIRASLVKVEPDLAIERIQTTRELIETVLSPTRLLATATSILGGAGLLLLALGTFGAANAALRTARGEIAIRQAVGAAPYQAVGAPIALLSRALGMGIAAGLAIAPLALSGSAALGLSAAGGLTLPLVAGAATVVAAAAVACLPSIVQAARVSPAELLRHD